MKFIPRRQKHRPPRDLLTRYIESEEFERDLRTGRDYFDDKRSTAQEQRDWNKARARFEAMTIRELRAYNSEGVARPHRGIAKAVMKAKVQHRDAIIRIITAIAITIGGAGALAQAIVQLGG